MFSLNSSPGKFEGERSQLLSEIVYQATLDGRAAQEWDFGRDGYVDYNALVKGRRYHFMVHTDDVGFVYVETFDTRNPKAMEHLEAIKQWLEAYDPEPNR